MKLTLEEKLENVKLHIEDGVPLCEIQRTRGQNVSSLKYFVALYRKWGEKAFIKSRTKAIFTRNKIESNQRAF